MKKLIGIDLFCGAGGLSSGMIESGIEVALANEIEKDFSKTYMQNHEATKLINRDIREIDFVEETKKLKIYKKVDILCGGPPCQGFSTVGKKNFRDKRNSLFWEFLRAVYEIKPKYIFFENVAGFKSLYNGEAHRTLINELIKLGFRLNSEVLDAKDYGLPQTRKRTIIIGWSDKDRFFDFPKATHIEEKNLFIKKEFLTLEDAISDLPPLSSGETSKNYLTLPQNDFQKKMRLNYKILSEHNCSNYGPKMKKIISIIPQGGSVKDLPKKLRPKSYFGNTYARLIPDKPSPTITRNFGTPSSSRCIHPFQNRALSTREGARIQGFPDNYIFFGSKGSKNLQIGNAVPPIFGSIIAKSIVKFDR